MKAVSTVDQKQYFCLVWNPLPNMPDTFYLKNNVIHFRMYRKHVYYCITWIGPSVELPMSCSAKCVLL